MAAVASTVSDEELTKAIRGYPAIYDKNTPAHKNKTMVENCWKEVVK